MTECFRGFRENFIPENLSIHFIFSQNVSVVLLLDVMAMVADEG